MSLSRKRWLLAEIHYFQQTARVEERSLRGSRERIKELAAELRALQAEENQKKEARKKK